MRSFLEKRISIAFRMTIVSLVLLSANGLADSPSFDCEKAKSNTEKLICENGYLGFLDQRLAKLYGELSDSLAQEEKEKLKETQEKWLADRDSCAAQQKVSKRAAIQCISDTFDSRWRELVAIQTKTAKPDLKTYRNQEYGFEIQYPTSMRGPNEFISTYHVRGNEPIRGGF